MAHGTKSQGGHMNFTVVENIEIVIEIEELETKTAPSGFPTFGDF
jgi:hypothetical protein